MSKSNNGFRIWLKRSLRKLNRYERKQQNARMRNWGCKIVNYEQFAQRYTQDLLLTMFLLYGSWLLWFGLGFFMAVFLVVAQIT